jgi:predicted transcriptional regulator
MKRETAFESYNLGERVIVVGGGRISSRLFRNLRREGSEYTIDAAL